MLLLKMEIQSLFNANSIAANLTIKRINNAIQLSNTQRCFESLHPFPLFIIIFIIIMIVIIMAGEILAT